MRLRQETFSKICAAARTLTAIKHFSYRIHKLSEKKLNK